MATLLPPGKRQFFDALGNPLASGTVAYFIPGTSTPKNTWQDAGQSTLNTNPITLDAAGEAIIYGSGTYRELVKDSLSNTIWDQLTDQPLSAVDAQNGVPQWGGTSTGAANVYAITITAPIPTAYVAGQTYRFTTHQANTGAATLNVNALGAKNITKNGSTVLASGDIGSGQVIQVAYDGTQFELISAPGSLISGTGPGLQTVAGNAQINPVFFPNNIGAGLLTLSFSSTTVLGIAAGIANSSDASTFMNLASAFTKSTAAWAVGTGNGALDTGSIANSTPYFVYEIERIDTGVVDILFSASNAAPTMPVNYTKKRGIGRFTTDGSAAIVSTSIASFSLPTRTTFLSSSGTYLTPPGCLRLAVKMIGGGGGGAGSGTTAGSGGAGTNVTFGTALLVANGGAGGTSASGGAGGTASGGNLNLAGGVGGNPGSVTQAAGAAGGNSPMGGAGPGGGAANNGTAAAVNSGSGGGGAGSGTAANNGGGGGAGGYVEATLAPPLSSYAWSVGPGGAGTGGNAGTSGSNGGNGSGGIIIIDEYYV